NQASEERPFRAASDFRTKPWPRHSHLGCAVAAIFEGVAGVLATLSCSALPSGAHSFLFGRTSASPHLKGTMSLPLKKNYPPMEALPATELPSGPQWQYEPKWDGFRCLAFRDGKHVDLMSKSQKPLTRYFPELAAALAALKAERFILDGEIVIPRDGGLSFDDLLMRIHPAASRIEKLSQLTPSLFIVFDL